jgi:hypothetical protein
MFRLHRSIAIFSLFFFFASATNAQELSGWVVDVKDSSVIPVVHVINKTTLKGNITDNNGYFNIKLRFGDTIIFSNISYQYFYFVYNDSSTALEDVVIEMKEQNYLLHEVSIFSYKLTSNENKAMVLKEPLLPSMEETSDGRIINASLANPAEFLYNLFGSKPRQLRMLAQLKAEDAYREKLKENNNREIVVDLTGLTREELEAFMFYCKYSTVKMKIMNDYEFLRSVQRCYAEYVQERELEDFLQQFD